MPTCSVCGSRATEFTKIENFMVSICRSKQHTEVRVIVPPEEHTNLVIVIEHYLGCNTRYEVIDVPDFEGSTIAAAIKGAKLEDPIAFWKVKSVAKAGGWTKPMANEFIETKFPPSHETVCASFTVLKGIVHLC